MGFAQRYNAVLQHMSSRKVTLHLIGRELVAVSIGVFLASYLVPYSGLMLIVGILIMLPVLSEVLKERGIRRNRAKKRKK